MACTELFMFSESFVILCMVFSGGFSGVRKLHGAVASHVLGLFREGIEVCPWYSHLPVQAPLIDSFSGCSLGNYKVPGISGAGRVKCQIWNLSHRVHSQPGIWTINGHVRQCIPCSDEESRRSHRDTWQGHQAQTEMSRKGLLKEGNLEDE